MSYFAMLTGEYVSRYFNKIESVGLRKVEKFSARARSAIWISATKHLHFLGLHHVGQNSWHRYDLTSEEIRSLSTYAYGGFPENDTNPINFQERGKSGPSMKLFPPLHWFQSGRLLICRNCLQFCLPHNRFLLIERGDPSFSPQPSPLDSAYCLTPIFDLATPPFVGF